MATLNNLIASDTKTLLSDIARVTGITDINEILAISDKIDIRYIAVDDDIEFIEDNIKDDDVIIYKGTNSYSSNKYEVSKKVVLNHVKREKHNTNISLERVFYLIITTPVKKIKTIDIEVLKNNKTGLRSVEVFIDKKRVLNTGYKKITSAVKLARTFLIENGFIQYSKTIKQYCIDNNITLNVTSYKL